MAKARDTGSIFQWNDGSGEGLIWSLSTDTYVSCSRSDVKFRNIKVGDTVSFVKTQDYYTKQFKGTDVQRSYSHNIVKQNNPPSYASQAPPHGILYFQKAYYTQSQMTHIASKFKNHLERAPRVIFSDNYRDYQRKPNQKRLKVGPQAKVVAPYDRSFGFPIPTRFDNSNSYGFINNNHNFQTLIRRLFTKLDKHLRSGGDVIIPAPLESEVNNYKYKSMYFKKGKRVIYHNIGTALLKMDKLLFIQERIDELKLEASDWKVIKGEVNYHNYGLNTQQVTQVPQEHVPSGPAVGNRRMNTNPKSNKAQFERIDAEYSSNYSSAPRFLFGDNNTDKERPEWKSRQMFGGHSIYNRPPMQQPQTTSANVSHQQLIDQSEWQCNLCNFVSPGHRKVCDECQALKGAKKQVNVPNRNQNQLHSRAKPQNQMTKQGPGGAHPNIQKLYNQIDQLTYANRSLQNRLNKIEHQYKQLQIENKKLKDENRSNQGFPSVHDESQYLSWNNKDVGRWILSLNKNYKKYEQTLMNELAEEGVCGETLRYVKITDIKDWGIKNIVSRQDVFENIQRILRHNPQQKVRNAVEGIPTAYI
eukprot:103822_1